MNHFVNVCLFQWSLATPAKGPCNPQRGHNTKVENFYHRGLCRKSPVRPKLQYLINEFSDGMKYIIMEYDKNVQYKIGKKIKLLFQWYEYI